MAEPKTNPMIAAIRRQEEALVLPLFNELVAWEIGETLRARGLAAKAPIVIDIRTASRRLYFAALPGSAPDNDEWARRKGNLVLRTHGSSYRMGLQLQLQGTEAWPDRGWHHTDFVTAGGGFPVTVAGMGVVGVICVSGLPQQEDHELITAVLADRLGLTGLALT